MFQYHFHPGVTGAFLLYVDFPNQPIVDLYPSFRHVYQDTAARQDNTGINIFNRVLVRFGGLNDHLGKPFSFFTIYYL
jgi:hypothetical protein